MTYTQNYQLPQWVKSDRIMMDDFNDANSKIDTALHGLRTDVDAHETANTAAHAAFGNCRAAAGAYTGQGRATDGQPNTLTFPAKPMLVVVVPQYREGSNDRMIMVRDAIWTFTYADNRSSYNSVVWEGNSVSWSSSNDNYQFDKTDVTYSYVALLAQDG